jgi:hypothetical protein
MSPTQGWDARLGCCCPNPLPTTIDAAVVVLARDGDVIHTSDPGDLIALVAASGRDAEVVPV